MAQNPDHGQAIPAHPLYVVELFVSSRDAEDLEGCLRHWPKAPHVVAIVVPAAAVDQAAIAAAIDRAGRPLASFADGGPATIGSLYLAPPERILRVVDGMMRVSRADAVQDGSPHDPVIAASMSSLANDHGHRGIAVVFPSVIGEAFAGAYAVKDAGGMVMLTAPGDRPDAAANAAAPHAEIALLADYVLKPEKLMGELTAYVSHHRILHSDPKSIPPNEADLEGIVSIIASHTGVDFTDYKRTTLLRRIERRMSVNQITDVASFVDLLNQSAHEVIVLYREMLIGVTRFFRDRQAFDALRQRAVPQLVTRASSQHPARIWVAGCATGEEAYSLAITLYEAFEEHGKPVELKIFATDLDREAIQFASTGLYPSTIAEDVPPEILDRYFTKRGPNFEISKRIRELVVFAPHNIIKDPPFYRLDLVSCRNLLIYLQPVLQRKLFSSFHFGLNPDGFLLLGTSESLGDMAPFFEPLDATWKVFQKKPGKKLPLVADNLFSDRIRYRPGLARSPQSEAPASGESLQDAIAQTLLREFLPAFLVVDEQFEILHISGEVGRYLKIPPGKPSFNLVKMAPRELAVALSTGIRRALNDNESVVFDDVVVDREREWKVRLVVRPFIHREDLGKLVVVVFEEQVSTAASTPSTVSAGGKPFDLASQAEQRIKDLELEVEQTAESLQAAIEELETSNEELQATNEEVLAANEELQSTNEELQSVNEELYTVNSECQAKIGELTELNNDIVNFLGSTNIGTVFLDVELRVRKFTPAATEQINLIDKDIGRPLQHISNNIQYADLLADAAAVLKTLIPSQREVTTRLGKWFLMRILPYRTQDDVIKGVVITFLDISELKGATESVRKLTMVVEHMSSIAVITDGAGVIEYVNRRFTDATGWRADETLGKTAGSLIADGVDGGKATPRPWPDLAAGGRWAGRLRIRTRHGGAFWEDAVVVPMLDGGGRVSNYLKMSTAE